MPNTQNNNTKPSILGGHAQHYINGEWINTGDKKESINPSTGEVIGTYVKGGEEEAQNAIKAAKDTFDNTDWKTNRDLRYRVLIAMADAFEARQDELAQMIATENGKALAEAQFEASFVMPNIRYAASKIYTDYGRTAEWSAGKYSILIKEAMGVAGISTPWNSPAALLVRSLAPALAAGCTTVLKMPAETALTNSVIMDIIASVEELPKGVVNMVTGGREVLTPLVQHPDVPTISFTGSTSTGRALMKEGAERLKLFGLELGGKTPHIVFKDADIEACLPKVEKGLTTFTGQFCMTGSRILVEKDIADEVREKLSKRFENIKVGNALDSDIDMGAMISKKDVDRVNSMVEKAIEQGAKVLVRGGPITEGELANGAFYRPTLLEVGPDQTDMEIVQKEAFGPVLVMQTFETERQAIDMANNTEFGLAACIWTQDLDRSFRVAREVEAGTIWFNDWATMRDEFEEGGYKQSGVGRLRGESTLEDFLEVKHIMLQSGVVAK